MAQNPRKSATLKTWHASCKTWDNTADRTVGMGKFGFRGQAMTGFDKIDIQRIGMALVGAVVAATACIGAAVAPAAAATHCAVVGYAEVSQFSDLANA